jgi:hypothetical protein
MDNEEQPAETMEPGTSSSRAGRASRTNGLDDPRAQLRKAAPTIDEVPSSRMIAESLTFLHAGRRATARAR